MGNYGNPLLIDSSVAGLPLGATSLVAHPMDADITTLSLEFYRACSGSTYIKIGTIQRRLAWPLRKDDTQIREAFHIFCPSVSFRFCWTPVYVPENYQRRAGGHPSLFARRLRLFALLVRTGHCLGWPGDIQAYNLIGRRFRCAKN